MRATDGADRLIGDVARQPLSGWDFSALVGRAVSESLPWDYLELARSAAARCDRALDVDTGGGEVLASVEVPRGSAALEPYPPNLPLARERLLPYGIEVRARSDHRLPYEDNAFDLVLNRHGDLEPSEIARVLRPDGRLLSQQVAAGNDPEFNNALGAPLPVGGLRGTAEAAALLQSAGLEVVHVREAWPTTRYLDVGAVVLHLRTVTWQVPGFDPDRHRPQLHAIDRIIRTRGAFVVTSHRVLMEAVRRPGS